MANFTINGKVLHTQLGEGFFVADLGHSAVIRFGETAFYLSFITFLEKII